MRAFLLALVVLSACSADSRRTAFLASQGFSAGMNRELDRQAVETSGASAAIRLQAPPQRCRTDCTTIGGLAHCDTRCP